MTSRTATTHDFRGQLAVVTGGARGIGGAVVDRLIASTPRSPSGTWMATKRVAKRIPSAQRQKA